MFEISHKKFLVGLLMSLSLVSLVLFLAVAGVQATDCDSDGNISPCDYPDNSMCTEQYCKPADCTCATATGDCGPTNCEACLIQSECTNISVTQGQCAWRGISRTSGTCVPVGGSLGLTKRDLPALVMQIVQYALGFAGLVAVIVIIIGGFKWMVAAGNEEKVSGAKNLIIGGVIGLVIAILAYAVLTFVIGLL